MKLLPLKPFNEFVKDSKYLRLEKNVNMFFNMLSSILNFPDIEEKLNIRQGTLKAVCLTQGIVGISKHNDEYVLVFNIAPAGSNENGSKGMLDTNLRMLSCNGSYFYKGQLFTKKFEVNKDIVLLYNDEQGQPEYIMDELAEFMTENDISLHLNIINTRNSPLFECEDESEKKQYTEAYDGIKDGKLGIVVKPKGQELNPYKVEGDKILLDLTNPQFASNTQYLSHLYDDLMKRFGNLYGCCLNMSSKQAQQSEKEISGMESMSWIIPINMLRYAQEFCRDFKKVYDVDLSVGFGIVHELNYHKFANECTKEDEDKDIDTEQKEQEDEKDGNTEHQEVMDGIEDEKQDVIDE